MSLLRRRNAGAEKQSPEKKQDPLDRPRNKPEPAKPEAPERPTNAGGTIVQTPAHIETAIANLTAKLAQTMERIDLVEHKLHELAETMTNFPSHSDVLEVRMHSAKLASELARSTMELRGEIGMANDEARRAARMAASPDSNDPAVYIPEDLQIDIRTRPAAPPSGAGTRSESA